MPRAGKQQVRLPVLMTEPVAPAAVRTNSETHQAQDYEREKVATWMIAQGFATGDGESLENLLGELAVQMTEIRASRKLWQPISTAPRDASLVDIWCEYYDEDDKLYEAERRTDCHFVESVGCWFDGNIKLGGEHADVRITYWMPLPERPSAGYDDAPTDPHHGGKIWEPKP